MNFINYRQFMADIIKWNQRLPNDLVAVAGIPRSGVLVATVLALHRNICLVTLEELVNEERPWTKKGRRYSATQKTGRILIVDDSVNSGETMRSVQSRLVSCSFDILYGAVYHADQIDCVDSAHRLITHPRCFEWNLFHGKKMQTAILDMDGVLCAAPLIKEPDDGESLAAFVKYIDTAPPIHLPTRSIFGIATSRLEKYRPHTKKWLSRHNVRYQHLVMSPHKTAAARRSANDAARRKAEFYKETEAALFIESSPAASQIICPDLSRSCCP